MTPTDLLAELRARGVKLIAGGGQIKFRPASAVTDAELEALKRHKAELLTLLAPTDVPLDMKTAAQVLGPDPDEHAVACLKFDVLEAVVLYRDGVRAGQLPPRLLVRGLPLADWLSIDDVARLLREARP